MESKNCEIILVSKQYRPIPVIKNPGIAHHYLLKVILSCYAQECSVLWAESEFRDEFKDGTFVTGNTN